MASPPGRHWSVSLRLISAAADKQPAQLGREKGMWTQNNGSWFQPITYSGYPDVPVALEGTTRHDVDAFGGDNYILELDVSRLRCHWSGGAGQDERINRHPLHLQKRQ